MPEVLIQYQVCIALMQSLKSLPLIKTVPHCEETRIMQRSASPSGYNVLAMML